mgnify:CR=1 FL=1
MEWRAQGQGVGGWELRKRDAHCVSRVTSPEPKQLHGGERCTCSWPLGGPYLTNRTDYCQEPFARQGMLRALSLQGRKGGKGPGNQPCPHNPSQPLFSFEGFAGSDPAASWQGASGERPRRCQLGEAARRSVYPPPSSGKPRATVSADSSPSLAGARAGLRQAETVVPGSVRRVQRQVMPWLGMLLQREAKAVCCAVRHGGKAFTA